MNILRILSSCCPFFVTPPAEFDDFIDYEYDEDFLRDPQYTELVTVDGATARLTICSPSEATSCDDLVVLDEPKAMQLARLCNSPAQGSPSPMKY